MPRLRSNQALGPGLLETAYQQCLCRELTLHRIEFRREVDIPVEYKGVKLECGYRVDLLVEDDVIVELKAVEEMPPVFEAQLLTYMRLNNCRVGLLINFHVPVLKDGITRRVL